MNRPAECEAISDARPECREFCGRYGEGIALVGHVFNAAFKVSVGMFTGSLALVADGAHSMVDAITIAMAMGDPRIARWFGAKSGAASNDRSGISSAVLFATIVAAVSVAMLVKGIAVIVQGRAASPLFPALGPALVSILLSVVVARYGRCVGSRTDNPEPTTAARECNVAMLSSFVCLAGVAGAQLGLPILDPLAAIVIAAMIPHVGYRVLGDVLASAATEGAPQISAADRSKRRVAMLSVASNAALVFGKLLVGVLIGSVSVISEAIHSGVDLLAAGIAFYAVKTSSHPEDEDHPYGHGKIENLSGTIEAALIFLAAGWIVFEAAQKLIHPHPIRHVGLGVTIMLVSALVNVVVSHFLFKVGKETDSVALQADAWHLRTDVWTSVGVMTGLAVIWVGRWFFPGCRIAWVDPVVAIGVAFLIVHAAWKLTMDSARDLLDASLPEDEKKWLRDYLAQWGPKGFDSRRLRTRKAGPTRFVEFDLQVEPSMSVERSHATCAKMTEDIQARFGPAAQVFIRAEPRTRNRGAAS